MKHTSHYRSLITLGIPIVIGQLGVIILGFADTLMIGHHSTIELSASSFVNNVFNLAIIFSTGFSYGLTPIVGSLFGQKKFHQVGESLKNSLLANTILAVLICLAMGILYLNLENLGQPEELLPYIRPYYLILLASMPFVLWFNAFKQFSDGITDTKTAMWVLLAGNVMNIIGNYVLIYGKFGFPELGLCGAGIATLISRIFIFIVYLVLFFYTRHYEIYKEGFMKGCFNKISFGTLNRLGWPIAGQMGMETASFSLSAIMTGWLGSNELAAYQIMNVVSQLCFMMYYGMGAAISVRISNFYGQKDLVNVRKVAYSGFHIMLTMIVILALPIFLFRNQIGSWFTDSETVSIMVAHTVIPFLVYQFGDGLQITFANSLRGIADVRPMLFYAFIAYFIISLPAGYFFAFTLGYGIVGIWMAFPFGLTSAGIMYYLRFNKRTRIA